jgi:hypothetical protein
MARFKAIVKTIKQRFTKKKMNQRVRQQLSYEEVIRCYEELST